MTLPWAAVRRMPMAMSAIPDPSAVDPFDFVIFGATGDLSLRKIIPALWHRHIDGKLPDATRIILVARSVETADGIARNAKPFIEKAGAIDPGLWGTFGARLSYQSIDVMTADGFDSLAETLGAVERNRVFYLSLSPSLFGITCRQLSSNTVCSMSAHGWCWKSRSAAIWPALARLMMPSPRFWLSIRLTESIIIWARKRSRT